MTTSDNRHSASDYSGTDSHYSLDSTCLSTVSSICKLLTIFLVSLTRRQLGYGRDPTLLRRGPDLMITAFGFSNPVSIVFVCPGSSVILLELVGNH